MSDTAPWEDFGGGTSAASSPPWEDFKQSASQGGVINNNATDQYPLLTALGLTKERAAKFNTAAHYTPFALRESTNEPPTLASALGAPTGKVEGFSATGQKLLKGMTMENIVQLPLAGKLLMTKSASALANLSKAFLGAVFAKSGAEQLGTVAGKINVTGLPATPINPLPEGGESITIGSNGKLTKVKNVVQGTDTDRYENLGDLANALLTLGSGLGMGLHTPGEAGPTGITPTMDAGYSRVPEERQLNSPGPIVPQERQLPRFAQTETEGMTQPSSGQVTELRSNTGSQFVTDKAGRTVDVSQLTPWEEAKVLADIRRGPEPLQGPPAPPWQTQKLLPPPSTQVEAGPTTLRQTLQNVEGQLKGENPQLPGQVQNRHSGAIDPEDLRPAIRAMGRIFIGERGDSHADVLERNGINPDTIDHFNPARGFVNVTQPDQFIDRKQAAAMLGVPGKADAGGLDSQELPGAAMAKLERLMKKQGGDGGTDFQEPIERFKARPRGAYRGRGTDDAQLSELYSGATPDLEDIKDVLVPKARLLLRDPNQLKLKTEGQVDAGQVVGRLLNLVPGGEKDILESAGIKDRFKPGQKTTVREVDEWVKENEPRVEVRKVGEGSTTPDQKEFRQVEHQLDTQYPNWRQKETELSLASNEFNSLILKYNELERKIAADPNRARSEAHWSSIAPKPESEMPGYVEGAVTLNAGKVDKRFEGEKGGDKQLFPSSHSFPPNTLGFFRGYMEERPDGGKTFHVVEVQSDWAQKIRQLKEDQVRHATFGETHPLARAYETASGESIKKQDHPLLRSYERLALKAAIEHARSEGADRIAVSDAETAMMTEGHDRIARKILTEGTYNVKDLPIPEGLKKVLLDNGGKKIEVHPDNNTRLTHEDGSRLTDDEFLGIHYGRQDIHQTVRDIENYLPHKYENVFEGGMRLHYDQTLPRTLKELTGQEGKRVEFGEHKMASEGSFQPGADELPEHLTPSGKLMRSDLIFHNPDGTPKTSISAREFPLDKTGPPPYSTTGAKLYSGIPLPELEKVWDGMKKWFAGPESDAKDWTSLRDPSVMRKEILESKTATPITSKVANVSLPTEGAKTTLADRLIGTKNEFSKKIASVQDLVNKGDKMYSPMDVVFDMADGGKATFDGPLFRNIRWPLDFDFNAELNLRKQKIDPVRDLIKKNDLKDKNGLRLGIYAMVQQGATERLVENGVPRTYINNIVKTITPGEKEVYNAARRQLDSLLPGVQQVAKDVLGLDVQPVENYFPMQRDWRDIPKPPDELAKSKGGDMMSDAVDFINADFTKRGTKTERGYTIERVPDAKTAVKLNFFDVYERHVKDVAHFIASQKRLNEIAKIVRDPKFAEKYGDVTQMLTMDWLNAYAKQGRNINALPQLDWFRKAVGRGVLGFRVTSQLIHLSNVPLGMQRAGPINYVRGLAAAMTGEGQAWLRKNLGETFERGGGELELLEKQGSIEKAAFRPQRELDKWNSQATALGIYLREGGSLDGPPNQKALAQARVEARRAVASPMYKDLPPMLRNQAGKLLFQFQNTFMDQWSNIRYDLPAYLRDNPKKAMGLFVALTAMLMTESGIKYEEKKLRHKLTGYHPKSDADETYEKKLGEEATKRIPGYGQLTSNVEFGSTGVPVIDITKEAVKAGANVYKAYRDDDKTGKKLAPINAATLAGEVTGVPGAGYLGQIASDTMKGKLFKPHQQRIQEVADKAGLDLSDFNQRLAAEAYMKETREPMTEQEKVKSAQTAMKNMSDRRQAVMNSLSKEDKQWLKVNKIEPPGFGDYLEKGKVRVPYTDNENKFATEMYKSEYENVISFLRNDSGFKQLSANEQQLVANEAFRDAANRARQQTEEVVKSGALVEKKKKRFSAFTQE